MKKPTRVSAARSITLIACSFFAVITGILWKGVKLDQPSAETTPPSQATQPSPVAVKPTEPVKVAKPASLQLSDVQSAIARVYEGTVTVVPNRFLVGDFDGDGSQDLVAVVSPITAMLPRLNSELARWKLEDPRKVAFPDLKDLPQNPPVAPVRAVEGEPLLVIIHGSGPEGWRNPEAMNTYLLKNAVGNNLGPQPLKQALVAIRGHRSKNDLLALKGDVIKQTLGKEDGFLFWTGADYAWHRLGDKWPVDRRPVSSPHAHS